MLKIHIEVIFYNVYCINVFLIIWLLFFIRIRDLQKILLPLILNISFGGINTYCIKSEWNII